MVNPFAASDPIGGEIIRLTADHSRTIFERLRTISLYEGQEKILKVVSDTDGRSQNELRMRLCLDHSTITKSVGRMERVGYLRTEKSKKDRRVTVVKLTEAGATVLTKAQKIARNLQ